MLAFPAIGRWKQGEVAISWTANSRKIVPQIEQLIEQEWESGKRRLGSLLFDGPMCRLESLDLKAGRMQLKLSRTSYKPFLGTNLTNAQLADTYGREVLANPVGLSAIALSSDGFL